MVLVFFFKQKTAYERRIGDWSSNVCASGLNGFNFRQMKKFYVNAGPRRNGRRGCKRFHVPAHPRPGAPPSPFGRAAFRVSFTPACTPSEFGASEETDMD